MPSDTPQLPSISSPGPDVELITDGVITAYIHAISDRHRRIDAGPLGGAQAEG
jgi:hypothetical protein